MTDRRCQGDAGASTVETAILFPLVLMVVVFTPLAGGLWWWGRQAAGSAAEQAAVVGSRSNATADDAGRAASTVLSQAGYLRDVTVTIDRGPDRVSVQVDGASMLGFAVSARAEAPVERVYSAGER